MNYQHKLNHPFFFFNDTATPEIYTLSLHDALPIFLGGKPLEAAGGHGRKVAPQAPHQPHFDRGATVGCRYDPEQPRSEEHTSELQSQSNLVCRLLLEKKKTTPAPARPLGSHTINGD